MIIYLAGGINANLKPNWVEMIKAYYDGANKLDIYLAGGNDKYKLLCQRWVVD